MNRSLALAVAALVSTASVSRADEEVVDVEAAQTVVSLYDQWRFQDADRKLAELAQAHPGEPHTLYAEGYERFLSGDYPAAVAKLKAASAGMPVKELLALAQGAEATIEGHQTRRSPHFVIRFPPEDAVLADYALEALEAAAAALQADLGFAPTRPIPVDILRSPVDLALVTALTTDDMERSGTIALARWGRIMLCSPRAMRIGYD